MITVNKGRVELRGPAKQVEAEAATMLHAIWETIEELDGRDEADERIDFIAEMAKKCEDGIDQKIEKAKEELKEILEKALKEL